MAMSASYTYVSSFIQAPETLSLLHSAAHGVGTSEIDVYNKKFLNILVSSTSNITNLEIQGYTGEQFDYAVFENYTNAITASSSTILKCMRHTNASATDVFLRLSNQTGWHGGIWEYPKQYNYVYKGNFRYYRNRTDKIKIYADVATNISIWGSD